MLQLLASLLISSGFAAECKFFYATKSQLQHLRIAQEDIRSLSRTMNAALKSSFEFLDKVDKMTLGIVSAALLKGHSFDQIRPNEWSQLQVTGTLLYQDQPFNVVPIRGASMTFSADKKEHKLTSGTQGEFAGFFYELVPYERLRLIPGGIVFEKGEKYQPTLKIPISVTVESGVCSGSFTIDPAPLEPISVIASTEP